MLNLNVGLLGHVDSGKTSLAKALSQTASTAAFDKSPQSQSRGITLDLGFSACEVTASTPGCAELLSAAGLTHVTCTLVDCPGHASLIRTVVGGSQIIDVMVLLVDATKGIQPQTAECLVLGEVLAKPLVVVINKVDAVQGSTAAEQKAALEKTRKRLLATFAKTRWPHVPMVEVSADPRGGAGPQNTDAVLAAVLSVADLAALQTRVDGAQGSTGVLESKRRFMMLVDHCFAVRGHGTVFTGTVLSGLAAVGDAVLIPELQETRKVKSLQVFKKSVTQAKAGDRVGLCVAQFDPSLMERGVLCSAVEAAASSPSEAQRLLLERTDTLIARVHRVRFHPLTCDSHTKFHITVGHTTVMGTMRYFSRSGAAAHAGVAAASSSFDLHQEGLYEEELGEEAYLRFDGSASLPPGQPLPEAARSKTFFAILLLEQPILTAVGATFVAMRLDVEKENFCRLAVSGSVVALLPPTAQAGNPSDAPPAWRTLPIVRLKHRVLRVDRVTDARTCIADGVVIANVNNTADSDTGVAKKGKDTMHAEAQKFIGLKVEFVPTTGPISSDAASPQGDEPSAAGAPRIAGVIDATFGKTGKVKLTFKGDVFRVGASAPRRKAADMSAGDESVFLRPGEIVLPMKKYPLALHTGMQQ